MATASESTPPPGTDFGKSHIISNKSFFPPRLHLRRDLMIPAKLTVREDVVVFTVRDRITPWAMLELWPTALHNNNIVI